MLGYVRLGWGGLISLTNNPVGNPKVLLQLFYFTLLHICK